MLYNQATVENLYSRENSIASEFLFKYTYPWECLADIKNYILELGKTLSKDKFTEISENVWVAKSAVIFPSAYIAGPCIIDENTEVRQCAFIRGSAIIGKNCVIGNSCELKNVIIFDNVQIPHFNYAGDSVIGYKSHMGAGSITSNVKSDKTLVSVKFSDGTIDTRLKKFGAMIGDFVEIGCNSVLNPGTVIGKNTNVYPLSSVRGFVPENSIYKSSGNIVIKTKKE